MKKILLTMFLCVAPFLFAVGQTTEDQVPIGTIIKLPAGSTVGGMEISTNVDAAAIADIANRVSRLLFQPGDLDPLAFGDTTNNAAVIKISALSSSSNLASGRGMVSVLIGETNDLGMGASLWIPRSATGLEIYHFGTSADSNDCKADIELTAKSGELAPLFQTNGLSPTVADTEQVFTIQRSEFSNTNFSGPAKIEFIGYSFQTNGLFITDSYYIEE